MMKPHIASWVVAIQTFLSAGASAQTIAIDSIPAYGTLGFVDGSVTGVDFATHHVATFIHIEGSGWWTKPTFGMPTVGIGASGSFTVNVGTGGISRRGRRSRSPRNAPRCCP